MSDEGTILRKTPWRDHLHDERWDYSTAIEDDAFCNECGKEGVAVLTLVAEHNAGEWYGCRLCLECLKTYTEAFEEWSGESGEVERVAESARRMFGHG